MNLDFPISLPDLGRFDHDSGLCALSNTSDGRFCLGADGVQVIASTGDRKIEFVGFKGHTLARVASSMGYPAYYPVHPIEFRKPVKAVLMDLDGTSVHSEEFWIWIIEQTAASLARNENLSLSEEDFPHISGHSVSEHLDYCIRKYAPWRTIEEARRYYFEHTHREMREILSGRGRVDAFRPAPGLKEFLLELKSRKIRVGLVTSGLHEKAWPEIVAAFRQLGMGDPSEFYDTIITAGFPLGTNAAGTLGELSPKPHPWLYAEAARVGLGMPFSERNHVVGIEDSGAGISSLRLAGFASIGMAGGNIEASGTRALCTYFKHELSAVLEVLQ